MSLLHQYKCSVLVEAYEVSLLHQYKCSVLIISVGMRAVRYFRQTQSTDIDFAFNLVSVQAKTHVSYMAVPAALRMFMPDTAFSGCILANSYGYGLAISRSVGAISATFTQNADRRTFNRYEKARQIKEAQDSFCEKAISGEHWHELGSFPEELQWEAAVGILRGHVKVHTHCYEAVDFDAFVRVCVVFMTDTRQ